MFRRKHVFTKQELLDLTIDNKSLEDRFILKGRQINNVGLINDIKRGSLLVSNFNFNDQYRNFEYQSIQELKNAVESFILQHLGKKELETLGNRYIQEVIKLAPELLTSLYAKAGDPILIGQPNTQKNNLYKQNGEIYIKTIQSNIETFDADGNPRAPIDGPIEILLKLTREGFELVSLTTSDKMIVDLITNNIDIKTKPKIEIIDTKKPASPFEVISNFFKTKPSTPIVSSNNEANELSLKNSTDVNADQDKTYFDGKSPKIVL